MKVLEHLCINLTRRSWTKFRNAAAMAIQERLDLSLTGDTGPWRMGRQYMSWPPF